MVLPFVLVAMLQPFRLSVSRVGGSAPHINIYIYMYILIYIYMTIQTYIYIHIQDDIYMDIRMCETFADVTLIRILHEWMT